MQVCNTFWLFLVEITKYDNYRWGPENPVDYNVELLQTWKNYNKERKLFQVDTVSLKWTIGYLMRDSNYRINEFDKKKIYSNIPTIVQAIDQNDYEVDRSMSSHTIRRDDGVYIEKNIPLLKASGFAPLVNPLDVYLSIEEFFSLNKQENERTTSLGITDEEKIENHGFSKKASFRGKSR